jgi:hypothetical protein
MGTENMRYSGGCFCGAVEITVTGEPAAMGYCHCASCRHWSAGPVNAFTLWAPEAVTVTRGAPQVAAFQRSELSRRKFCSRCGGHLFTEHPPWKLVDVYAALLPELRFAPQLHVNYRAGVLRIRDGLPKLADFPTELGGTGEVVAE